MEKCPRYMVLFVLMVAVPALGDVTGKYLSRGECLCTDDRVNLRTSACGNLVQTINRGECYTYGGSKSRCYLQGKNGKNYEFFQLNYKGTVRWAAGNYLTHSPGRCGSGFVSGSGSSPGKVSSTEGYTCRIANQGKRIHETMSWTPYDCQDCNGGNTCKGGQCVAYVACSCTRDGKHVPVTSCWRPGTRVKKSDGTCNSDIPINTAIATFKTNGEYFGHAAVFMGCSDRHTIKVYDQWCGRAIGESKYVSSHQFYGQFAVITNSGTNGCRDRSSFNCRIQDSGDNKCCSYTKHCSDKAKNKCV
jgi:hypothetical protein